MIIPILPSLVQVANRQHRQDSLIHLVGASSHGVANRRTRSLSSQLPTDSHGSNTKANHLRVVHSSSNKTRMYENSLASATSADVQATSLQSVGPSHSRPAEVTSLVARQRNLPPNSTMDSIIRETNERATHAD